VKSGEYGIVPLCFNYAYRHISVDHINALIDKLLDAMKGRLFAKSGTVRIYQCCIPEASRPSFLSLSDTYWPQDVDFNYGVEEVRSLCDGFGLARSVTNSVCIPRVC
jgi:hypothetical protein